MSESLKEGNDRVAQLLPEIERNVGYAIRNGGVGRVWLERHYDLKESEARFVVDYFRDKEVPKPEPMFSEDTSYEYDSIADVYTIVTRQDREIQFDGKEVRDIRRKYSNWTGDYATVREIANGYPHIHISDIKELLFAMDIIHDSAPFTDEEILSKKKEELVAELVHLEKGKVAKEYEKRKQKEIEDKARKYDLLRYEFETRRAKVIQDLSTHVSPREIKRFDNPNVDDGLVALVQPADIHFGKLATQNTTGNIYNREECRRVVMEETDKVLQRTVSLGIPKIIHLTVANDWFHIDTYHQTTTKGTPQDVDGIALDVAKEGRELAVDVVNLCKQYAPKVIISAVLSNHDMLMGLSLIDYLEAYFNQDPDVHVSVSIRPRQYFIYGQTLVGITHDAKKNGGNGLPLLMAQEAGAMWGATKYREIFTGHIHTFKSTEVQKDIEHAGVRIWSLPSLSATDHWHELNGYVKNVRSVQAHLLSDTEGHIGFFAANVIDRLREVF